MSRALTRTLQDLFAALAIPGVGPTIRTFLVTRQCHTFMAIEDLVSIRVDLVGAVAIGHRKSPGTGTHAAKNVGRASLTCVSEYGNILETPPMAGDIEELKDEDDKVRTSLHGFTGRG